jgi:cephalosporin-C deacetylase-like acetyl esterase
MSKLFSCAAVLSGTLLFAQDDAAYQRMIESKRQVTAYLIRKADEITARATAEMATAESWEKVRPKRLEEMRDMLGLLPWPARTPLNVRVTGVLDKGSYTVEKIAFESMPKIYVTGNLYIPKQRAGRVPAIVYVCGHSYSPSGDKAQYQRHGISFAKNGYAAFILDSIQIAETFGLHHGVFSQEMYDWYARGYTPAGVEVWNAMRAIDYLMTRAEVDGARIGMTGRSGGAAMSWFTAAVDPRVKVVIPVMGISTYSANVRANTQRGHCDCMFAINSWMHDMLHQGALIYPRPLLMAHGKKDTLFPVPGYEAFAQSMKTLYGNESFGNIVVDTGHQDSDYLRAEAIKFFDKHLMGVKERKLDMDYSNAPEETLAVFSGNPPADAQNFRVHETFTTRGAPQRYRTRAAWQSRSVELKEQLRSRVFASIPLTASGPAVKRGETLLETEEGITISYSLRKPRDGSAAPAVVYIASDGEDQAAIDTTLRGVASRGKAVRMVVYPRGVGPVPWEKSFWKDTLRNSMHAGRTIDSMRLYDVMRAVGFLRAQPGVDGDRIMVMGRGVSGAIGLYAAILDTKIQQVMLMDPPASHVEGPLFLNVLRYTDLPEAAALLAPRRLHFYGRMGKEFDYTRSVYEVMGVGDRVGVAMNIEYVAEGKYGHGFASGL